MNIAITDAKAQLTELVRRAEAGEDVVLTRHGKPAAVLRAAVENPNAKLSAEAIVARRRRLLEIAEKSVRDLRPGPDAARAADALYDDDGVPG